MSCRVRLTNRHSNSAIALCVAGTVLAALFIWFSYSIVSAIIALLMALMFIIGVHQREQPSRVWASIVISVTLLVTGALWFWVNRTPNYVGVGTLCLAVFFAAQSKSFWDKARGS